MKRNQLASEIASIKRILVSIFGVLALGIVILGIWYFSLIIEKARAKEYEDRLDRTASLFATFECMQRRSFDDEDNLKVQYKIKLRGKTLEELEGLSESKQAAIVARTRELKLEIEMLQLKKSR